MTAPDDSVTDDDLARPAPTATRRGVLKFGLGAAGALLASPVLAACGNGSGAKASGSGSGSSGGGSGSGSGSSGSGSTTGSAGASTASSGASDADLPAYVPYTAPGADIEPPAGSIALPVYYNLPTKGFKSVTRPVGSGETITMLLPVANTVAPPPAPGNKYWAELNKRLNLTLSVDHIPPANYSDVFGARLAARNLPDIFYYNTTEPAVAQALTEGAFLPLNEYVSGKKILDYPNLSHLQQVEWYGAKYGDNYYGVATYDDPPSWNAWYRSDITRKLGTKFPTNAKEFKQWCIAVTDPSKKRWALNGAQAGTFLQDYMHLQFITEMFRVPYLWRVDSSGNFTFTYQYPSYKEAISYAHELYKAGVYYPDSWALSSDQVETAIESGEIMMGLFTWGSLLGGPGSVLAAMQQNDPDAEITPFSPFGYDGGRGFYHAPMGSTEGFGLSRELEGDTAKIETCLRVLDYSAAPFGSDEWFFNTFGVEGVDYKMEKGVPTLTSTGTTDIPVFRPSAPDVLYQNGATPAQLRAVQDNMIRNSEIRTDSEGVTLFSETWLTKGQGLLLDIASGVLSIVLGQKPMSYYDTLLQHWQSTAGNQIAKEYQAAWKSAHRSAK